MNEDTIRRLGLGTLFAVLFFQLLFAEGGLIGYFKVKRSIRTANVSIITMEHENTLLKAEIDRLQNDDRYLEEVVRKKFGFVGEGERLYRVEK
ncbi:MAG: cell division protein FtsB [Syntrophorhabdus sp. PtaU1.Bin002]|nr:MAG: cell division protein FtsB [Syntrophorhabdus sp. PtaB.Bin006]OPY72026.1 MAG: cell division protein FtsB [Syntrophorhabdus sp. PtaU1.Bin002]